LKVCVSIRASTVEEALTLMEGVADADLLELRADYLKSKKGLEKVSRYADKLIVTVRRASEGGLFRGSEVERAKVIREALKVHPRYVDIEASSPMASGLVEEAKLAGVGVIASSHNLRGTPGPRELMRAWRLCARLDPDIVKVVTTALKVADNLTVLGLLLKADRPTVAFCMGPLGKPSRALAPLFGAPFTYASLGEGLETAPGQLSLWEVREVWRILSSGLA